MPKAKYEVVRHKKSDEAKEVMPKEELTLNLDIVIKGGDIIDGTGSPRERKDIGIKGRTIAAVGDLSNAQAATAVDATGQVVAPGFIDMHSHADQTILMYPRAQSLLGQGITTAVTGQCGFSPAPLNKHWTSCFWEWNFWDKVEPRKYYQEAVGDLARFRKYAREVDGLEVDWSDFGEWLNRVEKAGPGINIVPLVGHGTVRTAVMGWDYRRHATDSEVCSMKRYVEEAMDQGAAGISNGIDYAPNYFASPEESYQVIGAAAKRGGIFSSHWRRTGLREGFGDPGLADGLREAIDIARKTGARTEIAHLAPGWLTNPPPTGKIAVSIAEETLAILDEALKDGVDLAFDVIPNHLTGGVIYTKYLAASLGPWLKEAGSLEQLSENLRAIDLREEIRNFIISGQWFRLNPLIQPNWAKSLRIGSCSIEDYIGKTLAEIAAGSNKHPLDALMDIITQDPYTTTRMARGDKDETKEVFFKHPLAMVAVDTFVVDTTAKTKVPPYILPNPNSFGAMARFIRIYANGLLGLEEGIRRITGLPASRLGLTDRGKIAEGMKADLVVFNPNEVTEKSTDEEPRQYPDGFSYVFVNGETAMKEGKLTLSSTGKILRLNSR